jgi:hypothetical protein
MRFILVPGTPLRADVALERINATETSKNQYLSSNSHLKAAGYSLVATSFA